MTPAELVDLITREFPGWSACKEEGTANIVIAWPGSGDRPGHSDACAVVAIVGGRFAAYPLGPTGLKFGFTDPLTAAEHATGEVALSRRSKAPERKDFTQKPRIDLIPPGVLSRHVLPVLHDGAAKHGRDHWRGCTRREYALAAATHVLAYLDGEETDESGHAALAHAAANLLLALGVQREPV